VETDLVEEIQTQEPLPLQPLVNRLATVTWLSPNLEDEIRRLKARRQRLGAVNPNALAEYEEAQKRHTFLTEQAEDLQQAAGSLQTVIGELDQLILEDFTRTFKAIASEFRRYFTVLFGGGVARLALTEPDDPLASGVDIIAKPPGKRQQSLNLLSGGERALTAAALIFAILKVSPTPFCVLDEVDAMLDEANTDRFRETLCGLAQKTQFILITHNRHTIEATRSIYGISMADDQTSVMVSLKLEADPQREGKSRLVPENDR
jgi:chromosome segregation protein